MKLKPILGLAGPAFAAVLALGSVQAQAGTTYVYGDFASPSEPRTEGSLKPWLKELTEKSNGDIKTEYLGGGAVVTVRNGMQALDDGLVDGAFVATIYLPSESPVNSLFINTGAQLTDTLASTGALTETLLLGCPECRGEMEKSNVKTLGSWAMPSYSLLCKQPIQSLADAKGLRIRASGHMVTLAQAIGATPVNLTISDVFEALQRNQVDCSFGSIVWMDSLSLGDVIKNVVRANAGSVATPSMFNIRKDMWDSLSKEDKAVFLDTVPHAVAMNAFAYIDADERVMKEGYTDITPDADLLKAIRDQADADIPGAVKVAQDAGVADAQQIVDTFMVTYKKWEDLTRDIETPEAFEDLLRKEIYSKLPADY